ncbi:MAG: efflux RND transporter periplasmic adaptor subunit, partial [Nitrospinota bacterium]
SDPHASHHSESGGEESKVSLTLNSIGLKLAEVETAEVRYGGGYHSVRISGKIDYDETRLSYISAWVPGRIDKLFVDFTGIKVRKGEPLIKLYSPDLLATQEEYLQAIKNFNETKDSPLSVIRSMSVSTLKSVEEKLRLYGISQGQIEGIVKRGTADKYMTITSTISGTVINKNGVEGMYVNTGDRIYTIADLSSLWLYLDVYESDIKWLRQGGELKIEVESYPGEIFKGNIAFIDPFLNEKSRTIKVRVNVKNREDKLKPGMFVRATVDALLDKEGREKKEKVLLIPHTAPLITGKRAIVYVEHNLDNGGMKRYEGREVILGSRAGDQYIVLAGLTEGERVVTKGNLKIDSALQIQAKPSMMNPAGHYSERENVIGTGSDIGAEDAGVLASSLRYYISASKALSEDNGHVAAENLKRFEGEIEKIITARSLAGAEGGIGQEMKRLTNSLSDIDHNLDSLRKRFAHISGVMREIINKHGYRGDLKLYLIFCPEAFNNQGGYWLNDSADINNPYFGSKMLTCGEVKEEYGITIREGKGVTGHEGHTM